VDCSGNQLKEVKLCTVTSCDLWPYRMGKDHKVQHLRSVEKPIQITPRSVVKGTKQERRNAWMKCRLSKGGGMQWNYLSRQQSRFISAMKQTKPFNHQ